MKILITGGAGFIGSHLADELLANNHEVIVLDNLFTGKLENLTQHKNNEKFRFIKADITKRKKVRKSLKGVSGVIHEAAITNVPLSIKKPELTEKVNVKGTRILLEESANADVECFIYASSCAVYGEVKDLPISEDSELNPISPYGKSKLAAEKLCQNFNKNQGLDTVCLRYFNVYGPRQTLGPYAGVILKFLKRVKEGEPPIIFGDGKQTRDFTYVKDIVRGTLLTLEQEDTGGQIFNIGSGTAISINKLCETILNITNSTELEPIYEEAKAGDIRHSHADLSKAKEVLGFEPKVSLDEGLANLAKGFDS